MVWCVFEQLRVVTSGLAFFSLLPCCSCCSWLFPFSVGLAMSSRHICTLKAFFFRTNCVLRNTVSSPEAHTPVITEACIHLSFNPLCAPASPEEQAASPNQRRFCVAHSLCSTERVLLEFPLCFLSRDVKRHSKRRVPLLGRFPRDVVSLVEIKKNLI